MYDAYRRRDWARRAAHQDPNLDIETESWSIDDDLLKSVSTRLRTTLAAVGLGDSRTPGSSSSGSNLVDAAVEASRESSNAKLAAALEAQKRKQDNRDRKWQNNSKGGGKGGKNRRGNRHRAITTATPVTTTGVTTEAKVVVALMVAASSPATAEMTMREWTLIIHKAAPGVSPVSPPSMAYWFSSWIWQMMFWPMIAVMARIVFII